MREHLARQTSLSEPIKAAVATMINLRPEGRSTTYDLTVALDTRWSTITEDLEKVDQKPLLVAIMPERSVETMYENRSWLKRSPITPAAGKTCSSSCGRSSAASRSAWSGP